MGEYLSRPFGQEFFASATKQYGSIGRAFAIWVSITLLILNCAMAQPIPSTRTLTTPGDGWNIGSPDYAGYPTVEEWFGVTVSTQEGRNWFCDLHVARVEGTAISAKLNFVNYDTRRASATCTWQVCPENSEVTGTTCTCNKGLIPAPGAQSCASVEEKIVTQEPPKNCGVGNPIYPLTGSKFESVATGVEIGGVQLNLTYDSAPKAPGSISSAYNDQASFGELWFTNLHRSLNVPPTRKTAVLTRGSGRIMSFVGDGTGAFSSAANHNETLVSVPAGGYQFTDVSNAIQEQYSAGGQLTRLTTAQGKVLSFTYIAGDLAIIQDSDGKILRFTYATFTEPDGTTQRRIIRITDTVGRHINASYDAAGNLTTLMWQDTKTRRFLYENASFPWALTGVIDENNSRLSTFAYDNVGRAISTERVGGVNRFSVSYGQGPAISVVDSYDAATKVLSRERSWIVPTSPAITNPDGTTSDLGVQTLFGMPALTSMSQPAGSGCAAATSSMAYEANGNIARKDDFTGMRSCYAYDSNNLVVTSVEGLANTVDCATVLPPNASLPAGSRKLSNQWHPDWSMTTKVAQPLSITTSVYNGQPDPFNANAIASCAPAAAKTPDGKPIAALCKQVVQATTDTTGTAGMAATLDTNVAQRVTSFTYDVLGRTLTSTDPLGRHTTHAYFVNSAFSGSDQPSGPSDLAMDSVSLLLHGDGTDGTVAIGDSSLAPKPVTVGGNAKISTAQSKFGGSSMYFDGVRDYISLPADKALSMEASDFTIEMWIYKLGNNPDDSRLWNPNGDIPGDVYIGIDNQARLVSYGSFSGNGWDGWAYGGPVIPNNVWRHVALVRSGGTITLYLDGVGMILTNSLGASTLFAGTYSHVIGGQGVGADRGFNGYIDEVRITKGIARYTADFLPPTQAFPHVGDPGALGHRAGDLQSITNAAGHITAFNEYDQAGRVRKMTDPKGVVITMSYTPRGWLSSVTTTAPGQSARTTNYSYDNVGQLTGVTNPDGSTLTYSYDAAHRLIGATDAKGNSISYTLDNMGNRIKEDIKDPSGVLQRSIDRSFDALNRLQQVSGGVQ